MLSPSHQAGCRISSEGVGCEPVRLCLNVLSLDHLKALGFLGGSSMQAVERGSVLEKKQPSVLPGLRCMWAAGRGGAFFISCCCQSLMDAHCFLPRKPPLSLCFEAPLLSCSGTSPALPLHKHSTDLQPAQSQQLENLSGSPALCPRRAGPHWESARGSLLAYLGFADSWQSRKQPCSPSCHDSSCDLPAKKDREERGKK